VIYQFKQLSIIKMEKVEKKRVIIALYGDNFSQAFVISWSQTLNDLMKNDRYEILICPGKSESRIHTLGTDVVRGKSQKPFNGDKYDIFVNIDYDMVFSSQQVIELIESTKIHPVVSGYYMLANNKNLSVVKDCVKSFFIENGTFKYLEPKEFEETMQKYQEQIKLYKEDETKLIPEPDFMKVSYVGLGFFACRKEVLDDLQYPYFNHELQRYRKGNLEIIDMCNEEVSFCKNLEDAGYDIMLNTRLRVGHEKNMIL